MDLQVRLLSLFSDLGMRVRAGGPGVVRAMGALLPAIAAASEGLANATAAEQLQQQQQLQGQAGLGNQSCTQSHGQTVAGAASSRFNHDGFAKAQKEDGARMRVSLVFSSAFNCFGHDGFAEAQKEEDVRMRVSAVFYSIILASITMALLRPRKRTVSA
eukprot:1160564-Pelagomonas_calceolata.AAC.14